MVERFNGRISEIVQQTRFASAAELAATLLNYMNIYNYHIPQRAFGNKTPSETMKIWQENQPELFIKPVYDHPRPDKTVVAKPLLHFILEFTMPFRNATVRSEKSAKKCPANRALPPSGQRGRDVIK